MKRTAIYLATVGGVFLTGFFLGVFTCRMPRGVAEDTERRESPFSKLMWLEGQVALGMAKDDRASVREIVEKLRKELGDASFRLEDGKTPIFLNETREEWMRGDQVVVYAVGPGGDGIYSVKASGEKISTLEVGEKLFGGRFMEVK